MSETTYGQQVNESDVLNRIIRAIVLIVVALILAVVSVSFAVHHMRLKFEEEYKQITDYKMQSVTDIVKRTVSGDELVADPQASIEKYSTVFGFMLTDVSSASYSKENYALFLTSGGSLSLLTASDDTADFDLVKISLSSWNDSANNNQVYTLIEEDHESVFVPIVDSQGKCVAVFEYHCTFDDLSKLGNEAENRVMKSVILTVAVGIVFFFIFTFVPKLLFKNKNGGQTL
ncbi:MAG: hypothetical protein MJ166_01415 [Clostridia bacterium]|nr:hypothetical protein [Clostridia bacterium]